MRSSRRSDVGDVAAEEPAVRVQLVDDDHGDLLEELEPLGVVREDRRVEHVRVGDHDLAGRPDRRADRGGRVPVVGRGGDREAGGSRQGAERGDLVLTQGLCRKEPERPGGRVLRERLEDRQLVAQALPGRGGRHDADVASGANRLQRHGLVGVEGGDSLLRQRCPDAWIYPLGDRCGLRGPGGQQGMVDDAARQRRVVEQPREHRVGRSGRIRAHPGASSHIEQTSGIWRV